MTQKNFSFAKKFSLPLYFVSAADGTNVVKVLANQRQSAEAAYGSWSSREKGRERGETRTVRAGCSGEERGWKDHIW